MATYAQLQAIKSANLVTLFAIDGVVGVGIGPRTGPVTPTDYSVLTNTTGEDAIVVLITKVEAIANIPASLSANGVTAPTCVVPSGIDAHVDPTLPPEPLTLDEEVNQRIDLYSTESTYLRGGIKLSSNYSTFDIITETQREETGTLGCIAFTTDEPQQRQCVLTCHHVLINTQPDGVNIASGEFHLGVSKEELVLMNRASPSASFVAVETNAAEGKPKGSRSDGFRAGHPTAGNSSCCRDVIGRYFRSYYSGQVDAGLVLLREPTTEFFLAPLAVFPLADVSDWRQQILVSPDGNQTKDITGSQDIALADLQNNSELSCVVQKFGIRTRFTTGIVRCIDFTENDTGLPGAKTDLTSVDQICVFPYDRSQKKVVGDAFGRAGDSGSAVLNDAGKVVGIFSRGPKNGVVGTAMRTELSPIGPVLTQLKITIPAYDGAAHSVPDNNFAGQPLSLREPQAKKLDPALAQVAAILRPHAREIRLLVNRRRAVTAAWHRNGGPNLLLHLLAAAVDGSRSLPPRVGSRDTRDCLDEITTSFAEHGSAELKAALSRLRPALHALPGRSLRDIAADFARAQ